MGAIKGEWKACETASSRDLIPSDSSRETSASTDSRRPEITTCSGPLIAASEISSEWAFTAAARRDSEARTATIRPPGAKACISLARLAISFSPSSRLNTPATQAATYSPTLCPITTAGSTPHDSHKRDKAYSKAKVAGCV